MNSTATTAAQRIAVAAAQTGWTADRDCFPNYTRYVKGSYFLGVWINVYGAVTRVETNCGPIRGAEKAAQVVNAMAAR